MKHHHDARYPFLWVQTTEDERIIRENRMEFDEKVQFFSWDIAAGFQTLIKNGAENSWVWQKFVTEKKPVSDPGKALEMAEALPENSMIFMKDFHKYFEKITICRAALNLKENLKLNAKTICFLAAENKIPPELVDDITTYDYPYPDEEALMRILKKMAADNQMAMPKSKTADTIVNAMRGLTWEGAENALALALVMRGSFDIKTILDQKAAQLKASGVLEFGTFTEKLSDLYGLEVMKGYLKKSVGKAKARGILIYGVPGTGKSHTAKAVANEMGWPCLTLRFSALKDKYQGVAEGRLRDAFKTIRAVGKCVVFMDEIEAIASGISTGGDNGVGQALFKDLLVELEDSRGCGAYWIGTCNALDPLIHESGGAILRRFNGIFFADMPTPDEARGIADIWGKKEGVAIPNDYPLDGYSGADIAKLAETMAMMECSAEDAGQYILPYGKAHAEELDAIRCKAEGVCIWAGKREAEKLMGASARKVRRNAG